MTSDQVIAQLDAQCGACEKSEFHDEALGQHRVAYVLNGRLDACLFLSASGKTVEWNGVRELFGKDELSKTDRLILLSGQTGSGLSDTGPVVCACFGVPAPSIDQLIKSGAAKTAEQIGTLLKAGTNCGSCLPELRRMIRQQT